MSSFPPPLPSALPQNRVMAKAMLTYPTGKVRSWEVPWPECVDIFEIDPMSETEDRPQFDIPDNADPAFPVRLLVKLESEGVQRFFQSPLPVEEARRRLNEYLIRGGSADLA